MRTVLFISPHLDDVAFSCGGALARLSAEGWRTVLATVFTQSVPGPAGFALECQLDKGLPADTDYMALRRQEDRLFARGAGAREHLWLDHPEAPHRGYHSAPALFGGLIPGDEAWTTIAADLEALLSRYEPEAVFLPQGLGGHVDHRQVILAAREAVPTGRALWYRDAPYAIRASETLPAGLLPAGLGEVALDITGALPAKLDAAAAYGSQLGFQFGGEAAMRRTLARFAGDEARRTGRTGSAEVFLGPAQLPL